VDSSCEFGIETPGSIKCWETIEWSGGLSSSAQLHTVSPVGLHLWMICHNDKSVRISMTSVLCNGMIFICIYDESCNNNSDCTYRINQAACRK
jgi:hypothetical protein